MVRQSWPRAAARSIPVRLVGGVAIYLRGSPPARAALGRSYPDIDLVAHKKQSRALRAVLEETGFEPERVFNATHGARRLLYHAPDGWQVDVFLDTFEMSHTLDLGRPAGSRAGDAGRGRAAADQAADRRGQPEGPVRHGHAALGSPARPPGRPRPAQRHRGDRPVRRGLGAAHHRDRQPGRLRRPARRTGRQRRADRDRIAARIGQLSQALDDAPKSMGWKARARVGRRMRWYELPEEVTR